MYRFEWRKQPQIAGDGCTYLWHRLTCNHWLSNPFSQFPVTYPPFRFGSPIANSWGEIDCTTGCPAIAHHFLAGAEQRSDLFAPWLMFFKQMSGMSNKTEAKRLFCTQVKKPNLNSAFSHQISKCLKLYSALVSLISAYRSLFVWVSFRFVASNIIYAIRYHTKVGFLINKHQ